VVNALEKSVGDIEEVTGGENSKTTWQVFKEAASVRRDEGSRGGRSSLTHSSRQGSPLRAVCETPLRVNPEPAPVFTMGSRRVDKPNEPI
jgi:hypothetical protein